MYEGKIPGCEYRGSCQDEKSDLFFRPDMTETFFNTDWNITESEMEFLFIMVDKLKKNSIYSFEFPQHYERNKHQLLNRLNSQKNGVG